MNIALIGFGRVGQALIELFITKKKYIFDKYNLNDPFVVVNDN